MSEDTTNFFQVMRIDDKRVRDLRNVVRGSVEETLKAMLEAETEQLLANYEKP